MLDTYYKYRMEYKDFLLFIKVGNFYEVFDKDGLILNKLFGYKIKKVKDTIKVGFPLSRLDYILKLIGNINYVAIDNTLIEKKEFDNNKYKDYNFDINSIIREKFISRTCSTMCDRKVAFFMLLFLILKIWLVVKLYNIYYVLIKYCSDKKIENTIFFLYSLI